MKGTIETDGKKVVGLPTTPARIYKAIRAASALYEDGDAAELRYSASEQSLAHLGMSLGYIHPQWAIYGLFLRRLISLAPDGDKIQPGCFDCLSTPHVIKVADVRIVEINLGKPFRDYFFTDEGNDEQIMERLVKIVRCGQSLPVNNFRYFEPKGGLRKTLRDELSIGVDRFPPYLTYLRDMGVWEESHTIKKSRREAVDAFGSCLSVYDMPLEKFSGMTPTQIYDSLPVIMRLYEAATLTGENVAEKEKAKAIFRKQKEAEIASYELDRDAEIAGLMSKIDKDVDQAIMINTGHMVQIEACRRLGISLDDLQPE